MKNIKRCCKLHKDYEGFKASLLVLDCKAERKKVLRKIADTEEHLLRLGARDFGEHESL